jgi:hypothetical protein
LPKAFSQFAVKKLMNLPKVKDVHTSFSLGQVKASSALLLSIWGGRNVGVFKRLVVRAFLWG